MPVSLHITLFGEKAFEHEIERVGRRAMNMSRILKVIADDWQHRIEEQFVTEGKRSGHPWERLAFVTVKRRGSSHPILIDQANLFLEVTDESLWQVRDDGIEINMTPDIEEYGRFHQSGTRIMPERPIIDFTEFDERRDVEKVQEYLLHGKIHW